MVPTVAMIASSSVTLALTLTLMIYYPGVLELIMMKQINYLRCYYPYQLICWYVRVCICMYVWMNVCMYGRTSDMAAVKLAERLSLLGALHSTLEFYIHYLLVQDKKDNLHGRKMVVVAAGRCIAWLGSSTHRQQTHLTNNNHRDVRRRRAQGWDMSKKRLSCFDFLFWRPDWRCFFPGLDFTGFPRKRRPRKFKSWHSLLSYIIFITE